MKSWIYLSLLAVLCFTLSVVMYDTSDNYIAIAIGTFFAVLVGIAYGFMAMLGIGVAFTNSPDMSGHPTFSFVAVFISAWLAAPGVIFLVAGVYDKSLPLVAGAAASLIVIGCTLKVMRRRILEE